MSAADLILCAKNSASLVLQQAVLIGNEITRKRKRNHMQFRRLSNPWLINVYPLHAVLIYRHRFVYRELTEIHTYLRYLETRQSVYEEEERKTHVPEHSNTLLLTSLNFVQLRVI